MKSRDTKLDTELLMGAQYAAEHLTPAPGAIPKIPGVDIYATTLGIGLRWGNRRTISVL